MAQQGHGSEIIVIGCGLGGLIAATLLSKKIQPILLLKERGHERFYLNGPYRFLPFSNLRERFIHLGLFHQMAEKLELTGLISLREQGKKQKRAYQVILPKARIDLPDERSLLRAEWKREFPAEVGQIETFYQEMDRFRSALKKSKSNFFPLRPPSWIKRCLPFGSLSEMTVQERLASMSEEFRTFIDLQLLSSGNLSTDRFPVSLAAYLLSRDPREEWVFPFDLVKLEQEIFEKFLRSGGKIEEVENIHRIDGDRRKGFTVSTETEKDQKVYRAKCIIFNAPLVRLSPLEGKGGRFLSRWTKRLQPCYLLLPLFLGIREKVVPVGMADQVVSILDLKKPYEGGNLLFIALSPKEDETQAPEGRRALTVEGLMPIEKWSPGCWVEFQKEVIRHLGHLIPYLKDSVEFIDTDWTLAQVSRWSFPFLLYGITGNFQWRERVVPTQISKNLYLTGKENFPYLGLEGEVLGGFMVAEQILKRLKV